MSDNALYLRRVKDADIPIMLEWFNGDVGVLANGHIGEVTAETFQTDPEAGRDLRVAEMPDRGLIGVFSWTEDGTSGSYFIGIAISPEYVGTGYGTLLIDEGIGYLFDQRRAHRVELRTTTCNHHVLGMLRTGDMTIEGVLRENLYVDGRYESTVIASMLEDEYRAHIANQRMTPPKRHFSETNLSRGKQSLKTALASSRVNKSWEQFYADPPEPSRVASAK